MHPLTAAITDAVTEFSNNHQSLRQLMVNTLVAIVEGKVTAWLRQREDNHLEVTNSYRSRIATAETRLLTVSEKLIAAEQQRDELQAGVMSAAVKIDKAEKERDGWKKRAEAFLDFDRLKGVLHGEFEVEHYDGCDGDTGEPRHATTAIPWTTIKDILKRAALAGECDDAPVAHRNDRWLVVFEDAAVAPVSFTDEASARKYYADRSVNWNCHLFRGVESNHSDRTVPLFSAADQLVPDGPIIPNHGIGLGVLKPRTVPLVGGGTTTLPLEPKREALIGEARQRLKDARHVRIESDLGDDDIGIILGIDMAKPGTDRTAMVGKEETPDGTVYHLLGGYDTATRSFACSCGQRHAEVDLAGGKL